MGIPQFILVADLYKTYSAIFQPLDSNFVSQDVFERGVGELDVPTRITQTSAREVFMSYKANNLSFTMIAYGMQIYDRFKR